VGTPKGGRKGILPSLQGKERCKILRLGERGGKKKAGKKPGGEGGVPGPGKVLWKGAFYLDERRKGKGTGTVLT